MIEDQSNPAGPLNDPGVDRLLKRVGAAHAEAVDSEGFLRRFEERLAALEAGPSAPARVLPIVAKPERKRVRWMIGAGLAAAALIAAFTVTSVVRARNASLGATVYHGGSFATAIPAELHKGTRIATGAGGEGVLSLDGNRIDLYLTENTSVKMTAVAKVELEKGELWSVVEPKSGPFEIRTPHAQVQVQGTDFGVVAGDSASVVSLSSGSIWLVTSTQTVVLEPRQEATVDDAGRVTVKTVSDNLPPEWAKKLFIRSAASRYFPSGKVRSDGTAR